MHWSDGFNVPEDDAFAVGQVDAQGDEDQAFDRWLASLAPGELDRVLSDLAGGETDAAAVRSA